jgi:phosphopantetheinyl transferase (holo-ACP synthase)
MASLRNRLLLSEGKDPHKVSLPVQMAMQHYQTNQVVERKPRIIDKYFQEAEQAINQRKEEKRELINQYAKVIAERVMIKESKLKNKEDLQAKRKALQDIQMDPHTHKDPELKAELIQRKAALEKEAKRLKIDEHEAGFERVGMAGVGIQSAVAETPIDMSGDPNDPHIYGHEKANPMSLKGRIQQARNQLRELAELAESDELVVWERITRLSKGGMFMGLEQNLEQIRHGISELAAKRKRGGVASRGIDKNIGEDNDPCWDSHKMVGTKKKGGKTVPNCVPKE